MPTDQFEPQAGSGGGNVTMDGYAARAGVNQTLAAISAGAGTESGASEPTNYCELDASSTSEQYLALYRSILTIDTSALTADATIVSASLNIYVTFSDNDFGGITFNVVGSTPAADNAIVNADFSQLGTTKYSDDTSVTQSTSAYLSIPLNAAGLAAISKTGITKLGLRLTCDGLGGSDGTWTSGGVAGINSNSADSASNKPYLEVVYTLPNTDGGSFLMNFI